MGKDLDRGDQQPRDCRADGLLKVTDKALAAQSPRKGPLTEPVSERAPEALGLVGPLADLDHPLPDVA